MEAFLSPIRSLCKEFLVVKLAYFFGSRALNKSGPMSDYDFAFYLDEKDPKRRFEIRLLLIDRLSRILKTDAVDVVILNDTASQELKFNAIREGTLFYQEEPFRVLVEPKIVDEYLDFSESLRRFGLTKA